MSGQKLTQDLQNFYITILELLCSLTKTGDKLKSFLFLFFFVEKTDFSRWIIPSIELLATYPNLEE